MPIPPSSSTIGQRLEPLMPENAIQEAFFDKLDYLIGLE